MVVKPILGLVVGLQSLAVAGKALSLIPKKISKAQPTKKMVKGFVGIMVGMGLIKSTASIALGL